MLRRNKQPTEPEFNAVDYVQELVDQAVAHRASDIHFEPKQNDLEIRFRVDGTLHTISELHMSRYPTILRRIKVMGEMDFAESRRGQDGRARLHLQDRDLDLRISVLPTLYGDKTVMRLLEIHGDTMGLEHLGLLEKDLERFRELVEAPQGAVLVTGPTGSGKSSTLFSVLSHLNDPSQSIVTIEDPVERIISGLTQIPVKQDQGVTFAEILRSILRQDPDIVMVGEIRDQETAESAFRAAQTGHLLLSTLHTNSAASTITRLRYMGIPIYLLTSALRGLVAQRLVRKTCTHCQELRPIEPGTREVLQSACNVDVPDALPVGRGCDQCHQTGYRGRLAVFEVMPVTERIKELIFRERGTAELEEAARQEGMSTLLEDAIQKAKNGLTTIEEALRVVVTEPQGIRRCSRCTQQLEFEFRFCPYCTEGSKTTCGNCGALTRDEWRTCAFCGFSLQIAGQPTRSPTQKNMERVRQGLT